MLTHPTLDQLRALKLDGMADTFLELEQQDAAKDLTHADWLALLLDREITNRATKRAQIRLRAARLRYSQASVEDVNYRAQRQLDKTLFQQLAACRWIADKRNLLVVGQMRARENLAHLRTCSESLPRGLQRLLHAHAASLRPAGARAW